MTNYLHLLLRAAQKLNITSFTANESGARGRQIVVEIGLKLSAEDIE
jgi:hypothetical protein